MTMLMLVGRVLFGMFFLTAGANHFMKKGSMIAYAQSKGVPSANLAVPLTGLLLVLGGLGVVLNQYFDLSLWLLIIFLVPTSLMMHKFWAETDPAAKQSEMTNFMKNVALIGAALMLL